MKSRTPRLLLVLSEVLGWKTFAKELRAVADGDPRDIKIYSHAPSIFERSVVKRHNQTKLSPYHRLITPIAAFRGPLGKDIRRRIDAVDPDVILFGSHAAAAAHAYRSNSIPFAVSIDATQPNMSGLKRRRLWSDRNMAEEADLLNRAALLFSWSSWVQQSLVEDYGIPEERIVVCPPSLSIDVAHPSAETRSSTGLPKICFIGNDFLRKGGDKLFRWVTGPLSGLCELHIVSHDERARLEGQNVVVHRGMSNAEIVERFLPSMDLICHPTQSDMSAFVLVEAAAAGLPCVASRVGGIPDLVEDGETGFLVDPLDGAGFVDRLRRLLGDAELRRKMGTAAQLHAFSRFDSKKNHTEMFDRMMELGRMEVRASA